MKWQISVLLLMVILLAVSCMSADEIDYNRAYTAGEVVYYNHCQNCHGDKGEGLSALIPPLTDSTYFKKNSALLACIVTYGQKDKLIIVNGKPYQGQMPPSDLAPVEVAQVLTYVRNSFGNKQGPVTLNMVNKDLKQCK